MAKNAPLRRHEQRRYLGKCRPKVLDHSGQLRRGGPRTDSPVSSSLIHGKSAVNGLGVVALLERHCCDSLDGSARDVRDSSTCEICHAYGCSTILRDFKFSM